MKSPTSASSSSPLLRKSPRLSPYLLVLLVFIVFVTFLYGEDFSCIFSQLDYESKPDRPITKTKKNNEKLPFAIGKSEEECDIFSGQWVWDEANRPLYEESECPYIQPQLTCQEHGRPERNYQYWRWQPHGCSLPRHVTYWSRSGFGTFMSIILCLSGAYLLAGAVYRYFFLHIRGIDIIPNLEFLASVPHRVQMMVMLITLVTDSCC